MNRYPLVLGLLMLLILGACSKPDDTPTAAEDLRTGIWGAAPDRAITSRPVRVTYKDPVTNGDSTRDYLPNGLVCHLDNTLQFKTNNVGVVSYGAAKCSGSEAQTKTFTWQMSDDGKSLSMYGVGDFFGMDNVEAKVLVRSMGYLTIEYRKITVDPRFQTKDTLKYTDVIRRQ